MKNTLINLVKSTLTAHFKKSEDISVKGIINSNPLLNEDRASFVTLYLNGELRGCIGSIYAHQPLYKDIIDNSLNAAFSDPRFEPLKFKELKNLKIEVSVLSEIEKLTYSDFEDLKTKLIWNVHGVIIDYKGSQATYLPSVWNQFETVEGFMESLCIKAGVTSDCFKDSPDIFIYTVKKYEESVREMGNIGLFYPENCYELKEFFISKEIEYDIKPKAIIVPHAGYIYSGEVANMAYQYINNYQYKRIIVIGPSHHYTFDGVSGSFYDNYKTPCGDLSIDTYYLNELKDKFNIKFFKEVHLREHSTETQMPFIYEYGNEVPIIELVYQNIHNIDDLVNFILNDKDNLLVISTDLSHFKSLQETYLVDRNCLDGLLELDLDKLNKCDACGLIGMKSLLHYAKNNGLNTKLLSYETSFKATGDENSVVGYMSGLVY